MANENNDKDKEEKSQLSSDPQEVLPAEVLEALPKDLRSVAIRAASFRGPLPPPHMFSSYEETLPGAADRLLTMAEKQVDHQISWEKEALDSAWKSTKRGQVFGVIMSIVGIAVSAFLALKGATIVGALIASGSFAGLLRSFINHSEK